jgi:hypothetical protein
MMADLLLFQTLLESDRAMALLTPLNFQIVMALIQLLQLPSPALFPYQLLNHRHSIYLGVLQYGQELLLKTCMEILLNQSRAVEQ